MEAEVTTLIGSSSQLQLQEHCDTCGIHRLWTSRIWQCELCRDYLLCESCYKELLGDAEVLSAPPEVHCRDHRMSAHVNSSICDGCGSNPIWNLRWHCKVCPDFDLCEVCYGALDAADMPSGHLKEHPMIDVEVIHSDMLLKLRPSFSKPTDPQWSYKVQALDLRWSGFEWVKRIPREKVLGVGHISVVDEDAKTLSQTNENNNHSSQLKEQINFNYKSAYGQHASGTRKHRIFLSHGGPQKDFVEQLNLDLSRVHHFGIFFDKDDNSLPKGEPFPSRIFDAAKHCELAIVVISDDYFRRKWPMLELATFVKAQKGRPELKILPLFYKLSVEEFKQLSVEEFKQPKRQQSYIREWLKVLGSSQNEGDIKEWKEALKVISCSNGLEYDGRKGEVMFRREIVEAVCKQVKHDLVWDDSHVQGKLRLHKMIFENIQSSSNSCKSTLFMGLYGMGGSGKTTMCKVIGNQAMDQFLGQVCHIEFGSMDMLLLLKKLLQCFCSLERSLNMIDEGQALNLLKHHIPERKICLMIDNVSDVQASLEEARILLNLPFLEGSLILVTSRSRMTLEKLNVKWGALMKIPSLTKDEAKALFLYHTGCDTPNLLEDPKKVMEKFIDRCNFKVENMVSREYHPLALKVLGTRAGSHSEEWVNVDIDFKYHENESKHDIFSILRLSYDTLILEYKEMFLDIALSSRNYIKGVYINSVKWQLRCLYDRNDDLFIFNLLKVFQAKSLVEYYDAESELVYIHDLYREFAIMEVEKIKVKHDSCCCFSRSSNRDHFAQERRLCIYNYPTSHITKDILSCTICSGAELLSIQGCPNLESIDVPQMQNLKMFEVCGGCPKLRSVNLEGAMNLRGLSWVGFEGEYPDLIGLESLEGLWLRNFEAQSRAILHGCLDFSRNSKLEVLSLTNLPLNLVNLNQAVLLMSLYLENCQHLERFEGLEALVQLEVIELGACSSLVEFPSLANFPSLRRFSLRGAAKMKQIHGFANLIALRVLCLHGGGELTELPGIETCTNLIGLDLSRTNITNCSFLSGMKDLTIIILSEMRITSLPDLSSLTRLRILDVNGCEQLAGMNNTKSLPALEELYVFGCTSLLALPGLDSSIGLKALRLYDCPVADPNLVMLPRGSIIDMEMEDDDAKHSENDNVAQDCESQSTSIVTNLQEPKLGQGLWRCTRYLNMVVMGGLLVWWLGWRQGKRRLTSRHEVERQFMRL